MTLRPKSLVPALVVPLVMVTGCGGEPASTGTGTGTGNDATTAPVDGPRTAVLTDRTVHPVTDSPAQQLPATVTSHDGSGDHQVTVTDTTRVVSLDISGTIAATIWGLGFGNTIVGRDIAAEFPGMEDVPVVTKDGHSINAEAVLDLEPTLVITDGSIGPRDVVEQLRDTGVEVVFLDKESSFAGAAQLARDVAAVYGAPDAGTKLAEQITSSVAKATADAKQLQGKSKPLRIMFLYLRGSAGVYYLFGKETGATDLIDAIGGIDVATEQGWNDYLPMTDEAVVAADPDLILVMTDGIESVGGVDKLLADKPALALTTAGQHKRFVDMADGDVLSFGPRSAGVIEALAKAIYAPESS